MKKKFVLLMLAGLCACILLSVPRISGLIPTFQMTPSQLELDVFIPDHLDTTLGNTPLVIYVHGGGFSNGRQGWRT